MLNTEMTILGNLAHDPELRQTQNGCVVNITIVSNRRRYNKNTQQWENVGATFIRCNAFNQFAQNIADSLRKGMSVIAHGEYVQQNYTDRNSGQQRTSYVLELDAIGPDLHRSTVTVTPNNTGNQMPSVSNNYNDPYGFGNYQQADENPSF